MKVVGTPFLLLLLVGTSLLLPSPTQAHAAGDSLDLEIEPSVVSSPSLLSAIAFAGKAGEVHLPKARKGIGLQGTIIGQVTHAGTGRTLSGVQISVEGSGLGALTDASGRYSISDVPAGAAEVRAQILGFRTATLSVTVASGETTVADFELSEQAVDLEEIIVTGTAGGARRREIGHSVDRLDAAGQVELSAPPSVTQLLNARSAGVVIRSGTGSVGSGSHINIRGHSSISLGGGNPLIYVDGVRVDNAVAQGPATQGGNILSRLDDINPNDIQSIEVIKGPAAATLYGTEASGGVIQIITKRGDFGAPTRVDMTVRQGANWFQSPEARFPTSYEFNAETGQLDSINLIANERELGNPDVFRTGHVQGYTLSVTGAGENSHFRLSGSYDDQQGVEPNNDQTRLSARGNVFVALRPTLDLSADFSLVSGLTNLAREDSPTQAVAASASRGSPLLRDSPSRGWWGVPPEVSRQVWDTHQRFNRQTAGVQLRHEPSSWFRQRLVVGREEISESSVVLQHHLLGDPFLAQFYSPTAARGWKQVNDRNVTLTTLDYSGTATFSVTPEVRSRSSIGLQYYNRLTRFQMARGEEFPAPGLTTVAATANRNSSEDHVENTTLGLFVQQEIGWQDRLFLTGAVRADDNSAFGQEFDVVLYPKVSASWVVSEESFWPLPVVENARLRAAYGATGQQPEDFAALRMYQAVAGHGGGAAVTPNTVGNPDLGPERGEEVELGFEAAALDERVALDFTYYRQTTRDMILLRPVAPSSGFPGSRFINAGSVRNSGLELMVNTTPVVTDRLRWTVGLNLSRNENEILDLGDEEFIGGTTRHQVGYPIASYFYRHPVSAELDADGWPINVMCAGGSENNDQPVPCADAPAVFMGNSAPKYEGALNSTLSLGERWTFYTLVDFKTGHHHYYWDRGAQCSFYRRCEVNYRPERYDPAYVASVELAADMRSYLISDASFAKLREVSLNFRVPEGWAGRVGASRGSITVAARNLHTWTSFIGMDPESARPNSQFGTITQGQMPTPAQFITTVNVSF